ETKKKRKKKGKETDNFTQLTFLFSPYNFNSLLLQPLSFTLFSFPLFISSPLLSGQEMACVEAALKSSVRKELAVKSTPQAPSFLDDLWTVQNGTCSDDFSVDELLDFSNEEDLVAAEEEAQILDLPPTASISPKGEETEPLHAVDFGPVPTGELAVPADDLASLEWLSHFVEDSNSEYSAPFPAGIVPQKPKSEINFEPAKPVEEEPFFKTPVPAKARSKRTRTGLRVWSLGSTTLTDSSSSSTSSSSSSSSPSSGPWLICTVNTQGSFSLEQNEPGPGAKKPKKRRPSMEGGNNPPPPRRCSHCGVQKTPQWRSGPLGAKTLCNACGVRFKSGRLLPEYRPACSPTFSSELHSNHHRKVLEMRKKNDVTGQVEPGLGPTVVVPSF
ncbi:GATA transcription factor 5, partial [Linum perenne]